MAIENVQRNSTGVVKVTALDAIGNVLPEFSAAASDISITDGTNTYAVSSASWSNGIGLLNVTTPNVTGLKTLSLAVKGAATTLYPSPFQINLVDPYSGRFNTTGGVLTWDMDVTPSPTASMTDYSGGGGTGWATDGTTFGTALNRTAFTDTSQYQTSLTATPITLGKYRWGLTQSSSSTVTTQPGLIVSDATRLSQLCDQVDPNNLPIKSISMILWNSAVVTAQYQIFFWYYRAAGESASNKWARMSLSRTNDDLDFFTGASSLTQIANVFAGWSNKIVHVGVTLSYVGSTLTTKVYINGVLAGSVAGNAFPAGTLSLPASAVATTGYIGVLPPTTFLSAPVNHKTAVLDFCAYGDEKSADFFRTNAAAWGL